MQRAWRITKAKYAGNAFDGEGARLYGGRWSSPGMRVVYVAESLSLAVLEILVHLKDPAVLADYVVITIDLPDDHIEVLPEAHWPANWRAFPAPAAAHAIGDHWVRNRRSLALKVPSAVTPAEFNYLINPEHRAFQRAIISKPAPLDIDDRLLKR